MISSVTHTDGQGSEETGKPARAGIAVIIPTYNDSLYLREALESVLSQTHEVGQILVVDDGSQEDLTPIVSAFPRVTLWRKSNGGVSHARNYGLHRTTAEFVTFLDADDRLAPDAIEAGLRCFAAHPDAAMVYGAHRRIDADGSVISSYPVKPVGEDPYADLLMSNVIGMHATVLYRREALIAARGFDESLRHCEDYELYLRIARQREIAWHPELVAEYRWHGANTSTDTRAMLRAVLAVLNRHSDQPPARKRAWYIGHRMWREWYSEGQYWEWETPDRQASLRWRLRKMTRTILRKLRSRIGPDRTDRLLARLRPFWPPPLGGVRFGALGTTTPVSMDFGWDRGTPIDRYYIERFLEQHQGDIAGRVLEVGDSEYSRRFGGTRVTQQDVLHLYRTGAGITIAGDLTLPGVLPENTFDCIVFTETLQFIFDLNAAVARLHGALKPGGVLLLTAPGIRQNERTEWSEHWCWCFTKTSIQRLFARCFEAEGMQVESRGNVFAATAALRGVAVEEVDRAKLDVNDPAYPFFLSLRAQRG